jgi:hypothetical protein
VRVARTMVAGLLAMTLSVDSTQTGFIIEPHGGLQESLVHTGPAERRKVRGRGGAIVVEKNFHVTMLP